MGKRLLSGVKPTGRPHIGNYLGAMRQFVELQATHDSFIFVADYHALTSPYLQRHPEKLSDYILGVVLDYLAIGLDPQKITLYRQSDIAAHQELAWIFNCLTTMPYLMRAHAFKDAEAKNKEINVGIFDYPILMAADILLYDAEVVPVGKDQQQHLEIARDTAQKFNHLYGETFALPEALIYEEVAVVPGTDGRKMSKSYRNTIPLFADSDELEQKVMSIVTDSRGESEPKDFKTDTVFALHKHFSKDQLPELERRYEEGSIGYKESKEMLLENLRAFVEPLRQKRSELAKDSKYVTSILEKGARKAQSLAEKKMKEIRHKIGMTLN